MTAPAMHQVNKALMLLDRGAGPCAQAALRRAIDMAEAAGQPAIRVQAQVILGECLLEAGERDAARALLAQALAAELGERAEVVAYELERAREMLRGLGPA
ncbi:hypothetical protein CEG14_13020 [Bordetella genomosp. 1]|uniref:Type III secretion protein n=1 Tax=Bordetella genomosp. 1 TaxID=1395607 RepID=A0A261SEY0_9BORD|nr:hypothetical protein [Bordetella genomosp. 1]MDQ8031612.1 hypothetical protein [Bordetella sp.]OZI35959.1 hypothetical protein CEG14_13020 [Bordetella genomosp. 1]OZI58627.1 hypothetical protein CAL27_18235 [Bordetella genomosp. 1]